ncbi:hypothetical protein B6U98_02785 [Thermoplasmatales archaeon ex4572_165]|nr:MAG: hypothetical protein B6U98_02785 [Thermoplasmatales archaeon ex4572_165]
MRMIPNIGAVEYRTTDSKLPINNPNLNEDELKDAILERIQQLQKQQKEITINGINMNDPDGPLEGGLDDLMDYYYLFLGFLFPSYILHFIKQGYLRQSESILEFIGQLLVYGQFTFRTLTSLGEAFDVYDMTPSDGC